VAKPYLFRRALIAFAIAAFAAPPALADIYQWEYIDPNNVALGKQQSSTLAPGGAGANAAPSATYIGRNLTKAYLFQANFSNANLVDSNLTEAYLAGAKLSNTRLRTTNFTSADLSGVNFTSAVPT
jgi:hypothetical protein